MPKKKVEITKKQIKTKKTVKKEIPKKKAVVEKGEETSSLLPPHSVREKESSKKKAVVEKGEETSSLLSPHSVREKESSKKKAVVEKKERYFEAVGRRKTAVARVRLFHQKEGDLSKKTLPSSLLHENSVVNEKSLEEYFQTKELQQIVLAPLNLTDCLGQFKISIKVKGGGTVSQAEAARHGIARSLILFDLNFRKKLKKLGYLKRDPRMRERKKFGLKRARRAPQWSKR